jgi:hypothetical protein
MTDKGSIGINARQRVLENFVWDKSADKIMEVIEKAIG